MKTNREATENSHGSKASAPAIWLDPLCATISSQVGSRLFPAIANQIQKTKMIAAHTIASLSILCELTNTVDVSDDLTTPNGISTTVAMVRAIKPKRIITF